MSNLLVDEGCAKPIRSIGDLEWGQLSKEDKEDVNFTPCLWGRVRETVRLQ